MTGRNRSGYDPDTTTEGLPREGCCPKLPTEGQLCLSCIFWMGEKKDPDPSKETWGSTGSHSLLQCTAKQVSPMS